VTVYSVGLLAGALVSGAFVWVLAGLADPVPETAAKALAVAVVAVALARDLGTLRLRLPENRRLVPERVFADGMVGGALRFGFEMGTGVRTYVPSSTPYVLVAALVLTSSGAREVVLAAVGFAAGRAVVPWWRLIKSYDAGWEAMAPAAGRAGVRVGAVVFASLALALVLA
jgi:hypothetical protein